MKIFHGAEWRTCKRRTYTVIFFLQPIENGRWPWEGGPYADKRYRFCQTSVSNPAGKGGYRRVGFGRRRVGRGGR